MTRHEHIAPRPDPWSLLTQGMRQLSRLELGDLRAGLENFTNPSAAGMLQSLGRTRAEQVEKMATMLRNSSEADIEEMAQVFGQAMAKLAEDRGARITTEQGRAETSRQADGRRRARGQSAAERRRERRLAS
jgi:hypothetical protein